MASKDSLVSGTTALRDFLIQLGADGISHSGRSLYQHLCGVEAVLRAWEQPEDMRNAGMFHSIYSTERFHHATLPINERPQLQAVIGEQAERLVYLFAVLPRSAVFEAANSRPPLASDDYAELPCHRDSAIVVRVSGTEISRLALLHMANRLEQASKPATGIGFWLSNMSDHVRSLRAAGQALPEVLAGLGRITLDDERRLHSLYLQGVALLQGDDPRGALTFLDGACRDCGFVGEPYLMLAVAYRLLGELQPAQQAARKGRALLEGWGSPWHKRLSMDNWCALADLIGGAPIKDIWNILGGIFPSHEPAQAVAVVGAGTESNGSDLTIAPQDGALRFFSYLDGVRSQRSKRAVNWYPGLGRKSWYDPEQFPVASELEARFAEIKAEALAVKPAHYYEEAEQIGRTGSWQVCMFYEMGRRNDAVCEQCPTTAAILDRHDSVRRSAGLIYLSKMAAHTHVAPHQASSNIRLRCHLGLSIPHGHCAIRVGSEVHRWREGKCIVFDDTFEHEVWNRTNEERLVLLVDLWHPDLTSLERGAMDAINWLSLYRASRISGTWQRNDWQRAREGKLGVMQPEDMFG